MTHNSISMYVHTTLHCHSTTTMCVNSIEITVNTSLAQYKDQSDGIYSTGGQGFIITVSKQLTPGTVV